MRETYLNEDGEIWGYTSENTSPLDWVQDEKETNDKKIQDDVKDTLFHLLLDACVKPVLDLDKLETVDPDFLDDEEDLKQMLEYNKLLEKDSNEGYS